jgi:hypothetical protein
MFYTNMERRNMPFLNTVSDSVAKLVYLGEPDILPRTYNELEDLRMQTKQDDTNQFRNTIKQKKNVKESLSSTFKGGLKDFADDLDLELHIDID